MENLENKTETYGYTPLKESRGSFRKIAPPLASIIIGTIGLGALLAPYNTDVHMKNKKYNVTSRTYNDSKIIRLYDHNSDSSRYMLKTMYDLDGNGKVDNFSIMVIAENDIPIRGRLEIEKQITPNIQKEFEDVMKEYTNRK